MTLQLHKLQYNSNCETSQLVATKYIHLNLTEMMHPSVYLFLAACVLLLLSAAFAVCARGRAINVCPVFVAIASLQIVIGSALAWGTDSLFSAPWPIYLALAPLSLRVDSLSSVFCLLLGIVSFVAAIFSPGYLKHLSEKLNLNSYWACYAIFILGMLVVFLSANALTFLVFWEVMSLSSAALVFADITSGKAHKAGLIYLGATRIATAFLTGGFLWLHFFTRSWNFSDWHLQQAQLVVPSILVAVGLCIKAGIWPFHLWLPYAHPTAPSPISALMSGVMIKVAIYALIRFFLIGGSGSIYLAAIFVILGTVSALWGVLFAFVQHDLKKLLAYSTLENAGLILLSLGVCCYAQTLHLQEIAVLAFVAALYHCLNHGLFKSLLFLGAGAIDSSVHSREFDHLGGLAKKMPTTMATFLLGCAAISALPPLNGFASKWLIYQGLFQVACHDRNKIVIALALTCIGVLALVGGLALASFTKAFSVSFLGRSRSRAAQKAQDCSALMNMCQITLAVLCFMSGLLSGIISNSLRSVYVLDQATTIPSLPLAYIALSISGFAILLYYLLLHKNTSKVRRYQTWECGYGMLTAHMQVSAESFSHSIGMVFSPLLQYAVRSEIGGKDKRHFPERIKARAVMVSLLESRVYSPLVDAVRFLSGHLSLLQAGSIHLYLLYVFIVLVVMLVAGASV